MLVVNDVFPTFCTHISTQVCCTQAEQMYVIYGDTDRLAFFVHTVSKWHFFGT